MQRYAVENFSHDDPRVGLDSGVHTAVGGKKIIVVRQDASAQISRLGTSAVAIDGIRTRERLEPLPAQLRLVGRRA